MNRLIVVFALLASGCYSWDLHKAENGCVSDTQCGEFMFCETVTATCRCKDDRGCGLDEFCNSQNFCQVRAGLLASTSGAFRP